MLIKIRRGWELPDSAATPQAPQEQPEDGQQSFGWINDGRQAA